SFTNLSVGSNLTPQWDFGNSATSSQPNPTYTYPAPGTYNVTLRVTTPPALGCSSDTTIVAAVTVHPVPTANITANNTSSCQAPFTVSFNSNASPGTTYYEWSFGDNSLPAFNANPTHTYTTSGNFTVTLIVENAFGCRDTFVRNNFIQIQPTVASFTANPEIGCAPFTVNFTNTSTSIDSIVSRVWDFGDPSAPNNTSTQQNPSFTYNNVG